MPRPPSSAAGPGPPGTGWFASVPAYRLATLRVALAVTTLLVHVPTLNRLIEAYPASTFHVPPAFAWIPPLTRAGVVPLTVLQPVAALALLLGVLPRACAWFLAAVGFYVLALDPEHYAHNRHFHLTLLVLIGCSSDRVPLWRLVRGDDEAGARCPAWPEHLVRIQLAIVMFYAGLDKILSGSWGTGGALLAALPGLDHAPGLAALQEANRAAVHAVPGAFSLATIAIELFLAAAFLIRPLWRAGVVVALAFAVYLEFLVRPGLFTWDLLAALLVFVPAGDRGWTIVHDPARVSGRRTRALLSRLDWLRRLRWAAARPEPGGRGRLHLVSPAGRTYRGLAALRVLPAVLPGPLLVVMALARFGGGFLAGRGHGPWYDLPFLVLAPLVALWVPGVARAADGLVTRARRGRPSGARGARA